MPLTSDDMLKAYNEIFKGETETSRRAKELSGKTAQLNYDNALYKSSPEYRDKQDEADRLDNEYRQSRLDAENKRIEQAGERISISNRAQRLRESKEKRLGISSDRLYQLRLQDSELDRLMIPLDLAESRWKKADEGSPEEIAAQQDIDAQTIILEKYIAKRGSSNPIKPSPKNTLGL
jgi:hypothetical protein